MNFKVAKVYIRSLIAITAMTISTCYLFITDPIILGGYFTAVVACVLLDKGNEA